VSSSGIDGVIVGPTAHPIVPVLARELAARGLKIAAVNGGGSHDRELVDGVEIIACEPRVGADVRKRVDRLTRRVQALEDRVVFPTSRSSLREFEAEFGPRSAASVVPSIRRGEYAAAVVNELRPKFVWLNHVFQFGWAAQQIRETPILAMPWGGDIYNLGRATWLSQRMVRRGLAASSVVVPSAATATDILSTTYRVAPERICPLSWGVDLDEFRQRLDGQKMELRAALGLPKDAQVLFNARRMKPAWGSDAALQVMLEVARRRPASFHIVIAGSDAGDAAAAAQAAIDAEGLTNQFRIIAEDVSMDSFLDYCVASDVAVSLRSARDMRSLSILQCAAAGVDLICSDQPEYRAMEQAGFVARFVDPENPGSVLSAVMEAIDALDEDRVNRAAAGRAFIEEHEDRSKQLARLVSLIEETAQRG